MNAATSRADWLAGLKAGDTVALHEEQTQLAKTLGLRPRQPICGEVTERDRRRIYVAAGSRVVRLHSNDGTGCAAFRDGGWRIEPAQGQEEAGRG